MAEGKGRVIFMQHGLNDNYKCFHGLITNLVGGNGKKYMDLGVISTGTRPQLAEPPRNGNRGYEGYGKSGIHYSDTYLDYLKEQFGNADNPNLYLIQSLNKLTENNCNVLIRTEFSTGVESLDEQQSQMSYIAGLIGGQNADVCFIGHSMGGLASLNYAMDYKRENPLKDVMVITIDTPYFKNDYSLAAWKLAGREKYNNNGEAAGQRVGYANRDLACVACSDKRVVLEELYKKWCLYRETYNDVAVYAAAVSMYSENSGETASRKGDGIVDVPAQLGREKYGAGRVYPGVVALPVVYGGKFASKNPMTVVEPSVSIANIRDLDNPYHHCNTPSLSEVATLVDEVICRHKRQSAEE